MVFSWPLNWFFFSEFAFCVQSHLSGASVSFDFFPFNESDCPCIEGNSSESFGQKQPAEQFTSAAQFGEEASWNYSAVLMGALTMAEAGRSAPVHLKIWENRSFFQKNQRVRTITGPSNWLNSSMRKSMWWSPFNPLVAIENPLKAHCVN